MFWSRFFLALGLTLGLVAGAWAAKPNVPITFMAPSTPPSISFVACTENAANNTTFTFTGHAIGTASSTRYNILGIIGNDSASVFNVSSVTVGGTSATIVADEGGTLIRDAAIAIVAKPTGTTADIVVTWSEATVGMGLCVWAAYNLSSPTPYATRTASGPGNTSRTLNLNTPPNGVVVGVCGGNGATGPWSWTGLTERSDVAGADTDFTGADKTEGASGSSPLSVTCLGSNNPDAAGAAASFL